MNKSIFILATLQLLISLNLSSQEVKLKTDISEVRKNKFQVELGFRSIKNVYDNTTSATVLFKKKYNPGKLIDISSIKYLRAFFSFNNQINFKKDPTRFSFDSTDLEFHPSNLIDLTVGFGIEKQFQNRRFIHYFGCDIFTRYYKSDDDYPDNLFIGGIGLNATETTDRLVRTINSGLIPFVGLKFYVTDQFCIGLETGFSLNYFNSKFYN